jgi:membrane protein required for colicin V production
MTMHWIDLAIIAVIALSIITGLFRGFVKELIALCSWALAIWLGYSYSQNIAPSFGSYIHNPTARTALAFLLIVIGTLIAGGILNATLGFILKRTGLSGTDRSLGMIFGFLRGVFIIALVMVGVQMTSLPYQQYARDSYLYAYFNPITAKLQAYVPKLINHVKSADMLPYGSSDLIFQN